MTYTTFKNITATIKIWNGKEYEDISREFEVEVRPFGKLYNLDMVSWVINESRRVSNIITIECEGKKHTYSL